MGQEQNAFALLSDYEAIAEWFALQSKKVRLNAKITDCGILGQNYMLHIDKNVPPKFIPMMPRSAAKTEDNTTPRVTVAPTLIGCYLGYARGDADFGVGSSPAVNKKDGYRGGYVISMLPFKHCLVPGSRLVYDAERSGEHWLVPYAKDSLEYPSSEVGKIFMTQIVQDAVSSAGPAISLTFYIEVTKPDGIPFSPSIHLPCGCHKAEVVWASESEQDCTKEQNFTVTKVSKEEFDRVKGRAASMLSHSDTALPPPPAFARW